MEIGNCRFYKQFFTLTLKVVNAVVDNQGTVLNYSTNTQPAGHAGMMQQRTVMGVGQNRPGQQVCVML